MHKDRGFAYYFALAIGIAYGITGFIAGVELGDWISDEVSAIQEYRLADLTVQIALGIVGARVAMYLYGVAGLASLRQ